MSSILVKMSSLDCLSKSSLANLLVPNIDLSKRLSIKPAEANSSEFGKSDNDFKLKWLRKLSVVTYNKGFPGISFLPCGFTHPSSNNISKVPVLNETPLISSISERVTGWWYAIIAKVSIVAFDNFLCWITSLAIFLDKFSAVLKDHLLEIS